MIMEQRLSFPKHVFNSIFIGQVLFFTTFFSNAAEFSMSPSINMRLRLDDNIRLLVEPDSKIGGGVMQATTAIAYNSNKTSLRLVPSFQLSRYSEDVGLNNENIFIDVSGTHEFSEKHSLRIDASLRNEAVGVQDINVLGITFDEIERETRSINPAYTYTINERMNLQLSYSMQETIVEEGLTFGLNSSEVEQFSASFTHIYNEKTQIQALAYQTNFETTDTNTEITNNAFQLSASYQYSPSLSLTGGAGVIFSSSEFNLLTVNGITRNKANATGQIYNIGINKSFKEITINTAFERNISPGIRGDQDIRDTFTFILDKSFSEKLSSTIRFNYFENESQNEFNNANNNFTYFDVNTSVDYLFSKKLRFSAGYSYRSVDNENANDIASSNSVYFNINYSFDQLSTSR